MTDGLIERRSLIRGPSWDSTLFRKWYANQNEFQVEMLQH